MKSTRPRLPDDDDDDDDDDGEVDDDEENEDWLLELEWRIFIGDFLSSKPIN